jgi:hypothetical protein
MKFANGFGLSIVLLLGVNASANIIPSFVSDTQIGTSGIYDYMYSAIVDSSEEVVTGSQLCFSGITALVLGSATAPTGWSVSSQSLTAGCPIAAGVTSPNGPGFVDFTYTGSATIVGAGTGTALGTFSFNSSDGVSGTLNDAFGATSVKLTGGGDADQGEVTGPLAPVTSVPEPATMVLFGTGVMVLGLVRRRLKI